MANSQRKPLKKYKDNKNNLTKWEQELDEKLKDRKGFWQHLEEIQRDHPRPSYSFDGNDFFLEQEEDKIKLSKDFEEKKKYMEFVFETYLRQEREEGEGKEDDKESDKNADDGWQKFPTLTEMLFAIDPSLNTLGGSPEGDGKVKMEELDTEIFEASSPSIILANEQPLTPGPKDVQVKNESN
uniref:Uncharacterized protein n=1 Tax=Meloidogyne enterolobii TaxID=390850 RepID=A0A6V7U2M6_MELEN|nr:unnamed protein product [Meloidogyne enterolobii]